MCGEMFAEGQCVYVCVYAFACVCVCGVSSECEQADTEQRVPINTEKYP